MIAASYSRSQQEMIWHVMQTGLRAGALPLAGILVAYVTCM
jgi:hypothetical protein